jgi:hypothetical protein
MATRAIVPREDGEGSLGIETKRWGNIQTNKLNDISMPTKPSISDAGKVLKLNDDATEYEYSTVTFPNINIEDEGKVLQIISGSPTWVQIIKPRADGEGSLGLEDRQWGDIQTKKINGKTPSEFVAAETPKEHTLDAHMEVTLEELNAKISDKDIASTDAATTSAAGLMSAADKTKLDGVLTEDQVRNLIIVWA